MNKKVDIFSKIKLFMAFVMLFVMSCESYNDIRYYAVLLTLIITMAVFFYSKPLLSKRAVNIFFMSIVMTIFLGFIYFVPILFFKTNIANYLYKDFVFSISFKLLVAFAILSSIENNLAQFKKLLVAVLAVHVSFFILQFVIVYLTGHYIDPLYLFTGESQRYESLISLPIIGDIYRPTGFYVEPSTFATYLLWFLALKLNFDDKATKFSYIICIVAISTLSLAAMVYATLFLIVLYYTSSSKKYNKIILTFVFMLLPILFSYIFSARLSALNGSGESLRANLNDLVFNQGIIDILFGNGIYGLPDKVANLRTGSDLWRLGIAALNDNGLWLFLIIKIGLVGLIITIFVFCSLLRRPRDCILFFILLMTKISFFSFTFVFVLYSLFIFRNDKYNSLYRGVRE